MIGAWGLSLYFLFAIIILITHFLGGIAAFGSALLTLPLLVWMLGDVQTSIVPMVAIGLVQGFHILCSTADDIDWPALRRMLLVAGAGMPVGYLTRELLPQRPLMIALGILLVLSGLSHFLNHRQFRTGLSSPKALTSLLFGGGVIHGAFATGGSAIVLYAQQVFHRKEQFRATLNLFWIVLNLTLIVGFLIQRKITADSIRLIACGLPTVLLATGLSNRVAARFSQERFGGFVAALVMVAGGVTIGRAW